MNEWPPGWSVSNISNILHIKYGQGLPERVRDASGEVPVYGSSGRVGYHSAAIVDGPVVMIGRKGGVGVTHLVERGPCWPIDTTYYSEIPAGLCPAFIAYQLQMMRLKDLDSSTAIPSLRREDLEAQQLRVAPTAEQWRIIAAIEEQFSRLDAGLAALARVRQNLKRMRAAVVQAAVTEWSGADCAKIRFGEILREPLRNGHSAKADPSGTIPIFKLTAVTLGDFGSRNIKITAADPRRVRELWIQPGDLLIERSNTRELVGTARLYRGHPNIAVFPDLVIRARVDDSVKPEYAELILQSPSSRRYFQGNAQGISGSMPKIDQQTIEDLPVTLPSFDRQEEVVAEAERQLTLIAALESALKSRVERISQLRSSILAAAFSGRLVAQDPSDEPASMLLQRIASERAASDGEATWTHKVEMLREKVTA